MSNSDNSYQNHLGTDIPYIWERTWKVLFNFSNYVLFLIFVFILYLEQKKNRLNWEIHIIVQNPFYVSCGEIMEFKKFKQRCSNCLTIVGIQSHSTQRESCCSFTMILYI